MQASSTLTALHLFGLPKIASKENGDGPLELPKNQEVVTLESRAYRWLGSLSKELHRTQAKTLLAMVSAVCLTGKMRSLAIAQTLARKTGVRRKSAVQRFYRFVNRSELDPLAVWRELTALLLLGCQRMAVISIDWTEWRFDLRCLVASLAVGRRSAAPRRARRSAAFMDTTMPRLPDASVFPRDGVRRRRRR